MQFKPVPEPPDDLEAVAPLLTTVPETAGAVDDCCAHLVDETRLESRSAAETWLVFLRALGLVTAAPDGYRRTEPDEPNENARQRDRLRRAFRERVDGAEAVLEALERATEPLSVSDAADAYREETRRSRREDDVADRVRRLLEWAVLLDAAERTRDGRYRPATPTDRLE